jgi:DNA-binding NarL/FixJ family response regulator
MESSIQTNPKEHLSTQNEAVHNEQMDNTPVCKKRILVVDEYPVMREGIAALVNREQALEVCGEAASADEALQGVSSLSPDLLIIDLAIPGKGGLEFLKELRALEKNLPILVYSSEDEVVYARRVIGIGASGFLMKTESRASLLEAIRQIFEGYIYISHKLASELLRNLAQGRHGRHYDLVEQLSDREFEVFQLIGLGKDTREIASQLNLSPKTVDVHRMNIKEKLNLKTSAALIHFAVKSKELLV